MAREIIMPKLGMAMEEGTLVRWLSGAGEEVRAGELLLEIETGKVEMELEAEGMAWCIRKKTSREQPCQ